MAKPISMTLSNTEIVNDNEPQCIFVDDKEEKPKVVLKNCSKAIQHTKVLEGGDQRRPDDEAKATPMTTPKFFNNLFYYNEETKQIKSMNIMDTCLYVENELDANGNEISYISRGPCYENDPKNQFHFNENYQIVSNIPKGGPNQKDKCITAKMFIHDMSDNLYSKLMGLPIESKPPNTLYLEDCMDVDRSGGIFRPEGDQMFNYGDLPVKQGLYDQTGIAYVNLEDEYKNFKLGKEAALRNEIAMIKEKIKNSQELIDRQRIKNALLLNKETDMKKKEFTNIQTQTNLLHDQNEVDTNENTQTIRKTGFQQAHQEWMQYLHKMLFWTYYIVTAIFVLVFMIRTNHTLIVKTVIILLLLTYPFVVYVLEYYAAFAFYYSLSFILGKPYDGNRSIPLHLSFYKPSQLV